jgi:acetoin utilization deacetylase AcuC-like enzyme
MRFGFVDDAAFLLHRSPGHVERPERLEAVREALQSIRPRVSPLDLDARPAADDELLLVHEPEVLARVEELTRAGGGHLDPDTYVNKHSDRAARLAVGGGIDLCRAVATGELDRGFVLARPPGHHATPTRSMGFCLYSTVAIVARACADLCQRILILDWDVHHGNGTQDCLYRDGGTCFISLHQAPFYPGTGHPNEQGEGPGENLTFNLPLPAGCGDDEYLAAYFRLVRPIIRRYDPQLILVSAGYDAHRNDPLGGMAVSTGGFAALAALISEDSHKTAAAGRLVGFLEGGYDLKGVSESLAATVKVWSGLETLDPQAPTRYDDQVRRLLGLAEKRFL